MMQPFSRPLDPKEKKEYQDWLRDAERRAPRSSFLHVVIPILCFALIGPGVGLWVGLESDGPSTRQWQLGLLGLVVAEIFLGIFFWEFFKERKRSAKRVEEIKKALAKDRVEGIRVQASAVVAFEELGDLGPFYAFQVETDEIFCVGGQDYIDLKNFPNDDFEIVKLPLLPDEIRCHGKKIKPARTIPASVHKDWNGPNDGDGYEGKLADLERFLAQQTSRVER